MEIITLSNGKKVANFSSPHSFEFEDGTILPAVSPEEAERLKIKFIEEVVDPCGDVELSFELTEAVLDEIEKWNKAYRQGLVEVVYCPLPMIQAIKEEFGKALLVLSPFRSIRIVDRIHKKVSITKQCI